MFIPLGFGNLPRKFPLAVISLILAIFVISYLHFPTVSYIESEGTKRARAYTRDSISLKLKIASEACFTKYPGSSICARLDEKGKGRSIASEKEKFSVTESLSTVNYLSSFTAPLEDWPEEAKETKGYWQLASKQRNIKRVISSLYAEEGFMTLDHLNIMSLVVSSMTHAGWLHFLGNALLLFFIGVWVEQRIGPVRLLILFLCGSFLGLILQVALVPNSAILGASAGVCAVLGAFFVFFYRAQFQFLYTVVFYSHRIYVPILFAFPALYFIGDLIGIVSGVEDGIAHYAHFGGLLTGAAYAFYANHFDHLGPGEMFKEEKVLNDKLLSGTDGNELWHSFKEVMSWNCQNRLSMEIFLHRSSELDFTTSDQREISFVEKHLSFNYYQICKSGDNKKILSWLHLIPSYVSLERCLVPVTMTQVLRLADLTAQNRDWSTSHKLYTVALSKDPGPETKERIQTAIETINCINEETTRG